MIYLFFIFFYSLSKYTTKDVNSHHLYSTKYQLKKEVMKLWNRSDVTDEM